MKKTLKENSPCWDGYKQVGMKMKDGKEVPNCVPESVEVNEENEPNDPALWSRAKAAAKSKFDVYPSAYANGWASKWYKEKGGTWKTKKESVTEISLKSVGVKEFLNQLMKNQGLIKKLGFRNMRDVLAYIQGGGLDDWSELRADGRQLGMNVNEKLDKTHLGILKYAYKDIDKINPSDPAYVRLVAHLDKMSKDELKQIAGADIKFLSLLAKNRLMRNEDHSSDPNDKYVVKPCDEPGQPWAVWEGPIRVKGFASQEEAQAYADAQNKEQGLTEGNAFTGALYQARKEGKSEFEFNGKTYPVQEAKDETLEEGIKMKKLHEGSFSEIDIMAREARNFNEFVKEFYKDYKDFPKDKETIKWLKSLYDGRSRDESVKEGVINELSADTYKNTVKAALQRGDSKGNSIAVKALQSFGKEVAKQLAGKSFEVKGSKDNLAKGFYRGNSQKFINQFQMTFTGEGELLNSRNVKVFGSDEVHFRMKVEFQVPDNIGGFSSDVKFRGYEKYKFPGSIQFSIKQGKVWAWFNSADTELEFTRVGAREMAKLADVIVAAMDFPTNAKHNTIKQFDAMKPSNESVTEGISPKDMDIIKSAVTSASSFMNIGAALKKTGLRYIFATSPMPIYIVQDKSGNRVGIVNKKYADKPDFVHGDTAVGVMESKSVNEADINVDLYRGKNSWVVGNKFAKVASDSDIELMARLKRVNDDHIWQLKQNIKSMDHLYKKYKIQSSKGVEK